MSGPQPAAITLSDAERSALERLVRAGTTGQQLVLRARVVLTAATGQNNTQVAASLGIAARTVRQWRTRWLALAPVPLTELGVAARLADAPRSGAPARLTAAQVCQIIALACERPATSDRPISQWSAREVADEIVQRGIADRISSRHAARLLKSGRPQAASGALLAHARAD
ncbi:MAG: helix-turn-helix domain-containing protein [Dehalococcoidia bacterium]